ncbi:MAG: hypothetical protein IKX35_08335, partial [Bacteroidales bacterium]|nr:hypothetical protein [Bacteroidales bacterium]
MKKIYILLLLSALTFQSALAQNDNLKHPSAVAKEDGFSYRSLLKLLDMDSIYIGSKFESG